MHWRDASAVAAAVLHFARTREGRAKRMKTDPWGVWLWVGSFKVRLRYNPIDRVLGVVYIWRVR